MDLLQIGDKSIIGQESVLSGHTLENHIIEHIRTDIGNEAWVGARTTLLPGSSMSSHSQVDHISLVLKVRCLFLFLSDFQWYLMICISSIAGREDRESKLLAGYSSCTICQARDSKPRDSGQGREHEALGPSFDPIAYVDVSIQYVTFLYSSWYSYTCCRIFNT